MTEILTVRNLCKHYPAFELHDVSFSIRASSIMGLIGRNGAGKTTTIKSILRLVRPDGGSVEFLGQPVDDDAAALRREAGYVSGDLCYYPRKRLSQLTAVTRSFYSAWDSARYEALLRRFSLDDSKRVCELSAGMKVKYQLACALSHGAKLLILDEPTSGLDPVSRDDLLDLLRSLCEQDGVSILFSTHITSDLDACADDVTYLQNGTVAQSVSLAGFTAPWKKLTGPETALAPALRGALRGLRVHRGEFEALYPSDLPCPAGCREELADLQTVMVYLEREVETV
ncbi:MAG: ABC transporter ATP-binding protein [Clostridiales bacterium]|nr:ABC transporter ATP-binding protein [Bacillota bacterium]MCI6760979.1 ABC transporter ATP-binding protein [Clostridiales bacterium]MDD6064023.1 ABC transporter ATP-binding protein [Clostridiales bacterium]